MKKYYDVEEGIQKLSFSIYMGIYLNFQFFLLLAWMIPGTRLHDGSILLAFTPTLAIAFALTMYVIIRFLIHAAKMWMYNRA
jgi:hypothetical protein